MINAIAIDDEPPALEIIQQFCMDIDFIDLKKTFTQPQEALKYLKNYPVDLLFLDIQMPSIQGVDFYKKLNIPIKVIFTTAFPEFAVEGFNVNAVDYLLKPFAFERFEAAAIKALHMFQRTTVQQNPYLLVRVDYRLVKIMFDSILFVEGLDDYLKIHITNGSSVVVRMTMKHMLDKLPSDEFVRVHKSFIVALDKIDSIRHKVIAVGEKQVPIGTRFEQEFLHRFKS